VTALRSRRRAWGTTAALLPALAWAGQTGAPPTVGSHVLFAVTGFAPGQPFTRPAELAVDARHRVLYVADPGAHRIVAFSLQGVPAFVIQPDREFDPESLVVDGGGQLQVLDSRANSLRVFDASGQEQSALKLADQGGLAGGQLGRMALAKDGRLYVVDRAGARVLVLDRTRRLEAVIGGRGDLKGQLKRPEDVAIDRFGRLYVTDSLGVPVQVYDPTGRCLYRFGRHGEAGDEFSFPTALFIDRWDQIWVVDTHRHRVTVSDRFGTLLGAFGQFGQMRGQLVYPIDVVVDGLGRVYVLEREGQRLQVFTLDNPLGRFTP